MPTPIQHAPRLPLIQIGKSLLATGPKRPFETAQFITEVYRLGAKVGYDPVALLGQCCFETAVDGKPFQSDLWNQYLNPAGIGQTDGGPQDRLQTDDPAVAARAFLVHVGGYIEGPDGGWLKTTTYKKLDPRWRFLGKDQFAKVKNIEDWGGGLWASTATPKSQYTAGVLKYMKLMGWQGDAAAKPPVSPSTPSFTKKDIYVLVDAGHRESGPGGLADSDPEEAKRTIYLGQDDVKALRAAGYKADLWQEIDGDRDPTLTDPGDLSTVSLGIARVIAGRPETLVVFWSDHYNGGHSPAHVIVADAAGLTPAIGTAPADDTPTYNVWDVDLASRVAQKLKAATGMALFNGKIGKAGLMSEAESGVGLQGWRLALFGATAASRAKAIRFICEHGGYFDAPAEKDDFTQTCAKAKVAALDEFVASIA